jgi:hypothetical protein
MGKRKTSTSSPLRRKLSNKLPDVTITMTAHEDLSEFFHVLMDQGYLKWLSVHGLQLFRNDLPPPLHRQLSWKEWRRKFAPAVRRFWEDYTDYNVPKPRRNSFRDKCARLITQALSTIEWLDELLELPRYNGRPLTQYRLTELMLHQAGAPSREVCDKYARLWFLRRKLGRDASQTPPVFSLTEADLAFLKKYDPDFFGLADAYKRNVRLAH